MQYLKHISIRNKIYNMDVHLYSHHVFISCFHITPDYRGRKYSYRIFENILRKYKQDIMLECFHTCLPYYEKLGFMINEQEDMQGYYLLIKNHKKSSCN